MYLAALAVASHLLELASPHPPADEFDDVHATPHLSEGRPAHLMVPDKLVNRTAGAQWFDVITWPISVASDKWWSADKARTRRAMLLPSFQAARGRAGRRAVWSNRRLSPVAYRAFANCLH